MLLLRTSKQYAFWLSPASKRWWWRRLKVETESNIPEDSFSSSRPIKDYAWIGSRYGIIVGMSNHFLPPPSLYHPVGGMYHHQEINQAIMNVQPGKLCEEIKKLSGSERGLYCEMLYAEKDPVFIKAFIDHNILIRSLKNGLLVAVAHNNTVMVKFILSRPEINQDDIKRAFEQANRTSSHYNICKMLFEHVVSKREFIDDFEDQLDKLHLEACSVGDNRFYRKLTECGIMISFDHLDIAIKKHNTSLIKYISGKLNDVTKARFYAEITDKIFKLMKDGHHLEADIYTRSLKLIGPPKNSHIDGYEESFDIIA